LFPTNESAWAENFAGLGSARAWLTANTTTALPLWLTEEDKSKWLRLYGQENTVQASLNYYKALMRGVQAADEDHLTDDDRLLKVPVLTVGGTKDMVTRADQLRTTTEPWTTQRYSDQSVDAGHWVMLEQRENISTILAKFAASI
jgi:soluble epoxide hydrolase / lipid-phosphate phosphatase